MDIDAVLARRPQVALVDELPHSTIPGSRNAKRWHDVEELLAAGIEVISTVDIQLWSRWGGTSGHEARERRAASSPPGGRQAGTGHNSAFRRRVSSAARHSAVRLPRGSLTTGGVPWRTPSAPKTPSPPIGSRPNTPGRTARLLRTAVDILDA